jgi:hypothetical protein
MACSVQGTPKTARKVKSKAIYFDIKAIVHKEFALTDRTVNSTYYSEVSWRLRENVRRLRAELWRKKNWLLHHDIAKSHTFFSTREIFTKKKMTIISHPPYSSLSPVEDKTKGPPF